MFLFEGLIGWLGRALLIAFIVRLIFSVLSGGRRATGQRAGAPGAGRGGGSGSPKSTGGTRLVRDPNCGTYVAESTAVRTLHGGEMVYFCSNKCRDEYLAAPRANAS